MNELNDKSINELIALYSAILNELKRRDVIRTNNLVGDLGEFHAVEFYNCQSSLPNLQAAPAGTKNIDAISRGGERYSIKSTTSNLTGIVYDLNHPESSEQENKKFEYMIVVQFSKSFELLRIIEIDWELFLQYKRWHKTMRGWNISITRQLLLEANVLFDNMSNR